MRRSWRRSAAKSVSVPATPSRSSRGRGETLRSGEPFRHLGARVEARVREGAHLVGWALCFLVLVAVERDSTRFQYYPELNTRLGQVMRREPRLASTFMCAVVPAVQRLAREPRRRARDADGSSARHFPNIGWPLSQALVRPVDRALLVACSPPQAWNQEASAQAAGCVHGLLPGSSPALRPGRTRLLELTSITLRSSRMLWSGSTAAGTAQRPCCGPASSPVRLCFDETSGEWWFLAPRVEGTDEDLADRCDSA